MIFEISKEELYDLYIIKNLSVKEIAKKINISHRVIERRLAKYNIKKSKDLLYQKIRQVNKEKYGVENVSQIKEVKEKKKKAALKKYGVFNVSQSEEIKMKKREKSLQKYGTEYVLQSKEIRNKIENTNLDKYGKKNPMKNKNIQEKGKLTCLKKYGAQYPGQVETVKEKIRKTNIKKYGVPCVLQTEFVKQKIIKSNIEKYGSPYTINSDKIKQKIKDTCLKKYGVPYSCMRKECREANKGAISKINREISKKLIKNNINNKLEFNLKKFSYDIEILNTNILLEINPTYTHNTTYGSEFRKHKKKPLDKNYHFNKTLNAKENGYRCIHIWDWDDIDKIINILKSKEAIPAKYCKIKEVSKEDTKSFEMINHLQGYCNKQDIRLGLYYNDELVEIMTFGKPRYNKKYEFELLRLCSSSQYAIIGGSEKLFKYFIKKYNPKSIISYCDNSKFDGNIYNKLGFKLLDYGKSSKHWYNVKTKQHITDNLLRQLGFDILFNTNYGKGTSNEELMKSNGFVEIYDAGQSTYVMEF